MSKFMISKKLHELKEKFYKKNIFFKYQLNSRSWLILMAVLISLSGLLYLAQINGLATKGYEIKDLEEKAAELRDKNNKLKLQITDLRSTARINQAVESLEMVEVARVEYLSANGTSVAINR